ncbi:MAG: riboflavin synthase [Rhodobacteraceae bacterium]|nr:riboflavin synthase [Paracoccaceae bacterium]
MFTGIITDIARLRHLERQGDWRARLATRYDTSAIDIGASIACDGVCLTVVATGADWFEVALSAETRARTNLAQWRMDQCINLERSLRVGDELGGHIVLGHVDGTADITALHPEGDSLRVYLRAPKPLARFIAPKGAVALNGTSLTVNQVEEQIFDVNLIPHTQQATNWASAAVGQKVNLEIDTLARYVARLVDAGQVPPRGC